MHTLKRYTSEYVVLTQLDDLPLISDGFHDPKALKTILQRIGDDANRIERSGMGTVAYVESVNRLIDRYESVLRQASLSRDPTPGPEVKHIPFGTLAVSSAQAALVSIRAKALDLVAMLDTQLPTSAKELTGVAEKGQPTSKGERYVFISHSSKDTTVVSAVKQAFTDLAAKPYFAEETAAGVPPSKEIAEAVEKAEALFVFFTTNTLHGDTRDWIVFEIGVAVAHRKRIYSWKEGWMKKEQLPRLLEQVSKYAEFTSQTSEGALRLTGEIRDIAKKL